MVRDIHHSQLATPAEGPLMHATVPTDTARRSARARHEPQRLVNEVPAREANNKRGNQANQSDTEEEEDDSASEFDSSSDSGESDVSDAVEGFTEKKANTPKRAASRKQPKAAKKEAQPSKPRMTATKRGQKGQRTIAAADMEDSTDDSLEQAEGLYAEILDPNSSLESSVNDWMTSYREDKTAALWSLVNLIIHSCGCPSSISKEAFADEESVVDILAELQRELQENAYQDYPIVSKAKPFKGFRKNLMQFWSRLIEKAQHDVVLDDQFLDQLLSWLVAMSSSLFRPFRHTATAISFAITGQLCAIAQQLAEEREIISKQKQADAKKRGRGKSGESNDRAGELQSKTEKIETYLTEFFEGVFIHRCRDVEAIIRSECVKELGKWMARNPTRYLESSYLSYLGRSLNDKTSMVRLETLRSLFALYKNEDLIAGMRSFTERNKDRFIEMALQEVDISVRVCAIQIIDQLAKHGSFDAEDSDAVLHLIFSDNDRIRTAAAQVMATIFEEDLLEPKLSECRTALNSQADSDRDNADVAVLNKDWVAMKCIAENLVRLDKRAKQSNNPDVNMTASDESDEGFWEPVDASEERGRLSKATQALWPFLDPVRQWEVMANLLVEDHSDTASQVEGQSSVSSRRPPASYYCLSDVEESALLEILIVSVQEAVEFGEADPSISINRSKPRTEIQKLEAQNKISRVLVDIIPQLLTKYGHDTPKLTETFALVHNLNLDIYLDLRQTEAYEALLDQLRRLYLRHNSTTFLHAAAYIMKRLTEYGNLAEATQTMISQLQEQIVAQFAADVLNIELSTADLSTDSIALISAALVRIQQLMAFVNINTTLEKANDGEGIIKQVELVAERSLLSMAEEDNLAATAIDILFRYLSWTCQQFSVTVTNGDHIDSSVVDGLKAKRDNFLRCVTNLATNEVPVTDHVRLAAFRAIGDCFWLFTGEIFDSADSSLRALRTRCPSSLQAACTELIDSQIATFIDKHRVAIYGQQDEAEDCVEGLAKSNQIPAAERYQLQQTAAVLARPIMVGVFDIEHSSTILIHYGMFGSEYDEIARLLVEGIKDAIGHTGGKNGHLSVSKVYLESMEKSFQLSIGGTQLIERTVRLSKMLGASVKTHAAEHPDEANSKLWIDLLRDGFDYILRRVPDLQRQYQEGEDYEALEKNLKFFKVLTAFLQTSGLTPRDVYAVAKYLDRILAHREVKVDADAKEWEHYLNFVKNLSKTLTKAGIVYEPENESTKQRLQGKSKAKPKRKRAEEEVEDDNVSVASFQSLSAPKQQRK